jgi:hypothetical protein
LMLLPAQRNMKIDSDEHHAIFAHECTEIGDGTVQNLF